MTTIWKSCSDRISEFAPIIGLHKYELFYPTGIDAFLEHSCDLMVLIGMDKVGLIYARVLKFAQGSLNAKIQWMLHKKIKKRTSYLDCHGSTVDASKSFTLQKKYSPRLYAHGFKDEISGEAYLVYWFFYVENFVPQSLEDQELRDILNHDPNVWWSHEGDWEGLSLHFQNFQDSHPREVIFSQHNRSNIIRWREVVKESDRILVLPGLGTHANWNSPQHRRRMVFYAELANPDIMIHPEDLINTDRKSYKIEVLDPTRKHLWLQFKGKWGDSGSEFEQAPHGPLMKKKKHFRMLTAV